MPRVLVGCATGQVTGARSYTTENAPADTLVIHGECDETVPLNNVLGWARPQELPVVPVPGADHFFHGRRHPALMTTETGRLCRPAALNVTPVDFGIR